MKKRITRRSFFFGSAALGIGAAKLMKGFAALGMGAAALMKGSEAHGAVDKPFTDKFEAPDKPFIDQYYDGLMEIAHGVRDTSVGTIVQAMEKAYELKRKGGNIYCHLLTGHYAMFAGSEDQPGQPYLLPNRSDRKMKEDIDAMKKGDFLITNGGARGVEEIRGKGVYVVGITNNYNRFSKTPPDFLRGEQQKAIEDVCDLVIDSKVPYYNGLVKAPQIEGFTICPSSGISQYLVYWACTASLANLIGTKGKGSSREHAEKYLDLAIERFQMIGSDRPKIDWVGERWTDLVLGKKARLLVYGRPQKVEPYGGTVNLFVNESYIVASGSMIAQPYDNFASQLKEDDIVLIGSLESVNPLEINVARHAKSVKAYITAFTSFGIDGDSSGVHLFKEVDAAFNNYSDEREGVLEVKGFDKKICPLTGLTGNMIHWMLMAAWTDHMARRGEMPYYYQGYHERDGRDYDVMAEPYFKKRGY